MVLQQQLACMALKRKLEAMGRRAHPALSIVGWFFRLPWLASGADSVVPNVCLLALVAARASPATIREDATSVIVGAPPLEVGQQVWGLLSSGPGTASERRSPMSDGQIHPRNLGGVQSPREAQSL